MDKRPESPVAMETETSPTPAENTASSSTPSAYSKYNDNLNTTVNQ